MDELPRPALRESWTARLRDWFVWVGPARVIASAVAVTVVCFGTWWLVRAPSPPAETILPATAGTVARPPTIPSTAPDRAGVDLDRVVVHVAGAVARPGVYDLPAGSRVHDAILAAGGPIDDAEPDALNLAAVVVDGARIHVPVEGEVVSVPVATPGPQDDVVSTAPIDVNRATAAELETLPGVGPATASAIVTERERNGPFLTVTDLDRVPGIGPAKLEALSGLVTT